MSHPFASAAGLDRIRVGRQSASALRYTRSYMYSASIIARRIYLQILPYDVGLISRPNLTHILIEISKKNRFFYCGFRFFGPSYTTPSDRF